MKKRISLIVTAVALAVMMVVGGTLAWFTDTKSVTNAATFGKGKIQLTEIFTKTNLNKDVTTAKTGNINANGTDVIPNGTTFTLANFVPGDTLAKAPTVKNVGTIPMIVRATILYSGDVFDLTDGAVIDKLTASLGSDWKIDTVNSKDGQLVVYKVSDLAANDASTIFNLSYLFDAEECGNEFQNAAANITVKVDAIQSENTGLTKTDGKYSVADLATFFTGKTIVEVTPAPTGK